MKPPKEFMIDQLSIELTFRPAAIDGAGWSIVLTSQQITCNQPAAYVEEMHFRDVIWPRSLMLLYQMALDVGFFDMRAHYHSFQHVELHDEVVTTHELYLTDTPAYGIAINFGDRSKRVWAFGGQPEGFDEFVDMILMYATDSEDPLWAERKPVKCKRCGSPHIAEVLYGVSDLELELSDEVERGEIILADNLPTPAGPFWCCADCGTEVFMGAPEEGEQLTS